VTVSPCALTVSAADFDRLIGRDWQVIRIYSACVGCMVILGVVSGVVSTFDWSNSERVVLMVNWGGACIAALGSVLPVRQAWIRVDRIIDLKTLREKWLELSAASTSTCGDMAQIESIVWRLYGEV
jgi:hypothetical protein